MQVAAVQRAAQAARGRLKVIAVNDAYTLAPFADVLYFADSKWWGWHKDREAYKAFAGLKVSIQGTGDLIEDPEPHLLRNDGPDGISRSREGLRTGGGSGYMAIELARLAGCKQILLAGYDNRATTGKKHHFFGEHPDGSAQPYKTWAQRYRSLVKPLAELGVDVINCTPGSAIDAFPKRDLEAELARLVRHTEGTALPA